LPIWFTRFRGCATRYLAGAFHEKTEMSMLEKPNAPITCHSPENVSDPSATPTDAESEKRRHRRYRFREAILIRTKYGTFPAITHEISVGGLSVVTSCKMKVADEVRLIAIVGEQLEAIVRHKAEDVYGFEFLNVPSRVGEAINALCKGLFPFRGVLDR
jgi:hypothetical protein